MGRIGRISVKYGQKKLGMQETSLIAQMVRGANEVEQWRSWAATLSKAYVVCMRQQQGFPLFISPLAFIEPVGL